MKRIKYILPIALLIVLMAVMSACTKEATFDKIVLEGYIEDFFVGDDFTTGDDFVVYAVYSDGTRKEITEGYTVKQETGLNMYSPGDYMITVEYQGKKEAYTIYVNSDDAVLKKLVIDDSKVKKTFMLGELFSFDGIKIIGTYESKSGRTFEKIHDETDLKMFDVLVTDSKGKSTDKAFEEMGKHEIKISYDAVAAIYEVNVEGVKLDTIQNAIYVGKYGFQFVNKGQMLVADSSQEKTNKSTSDYEFGNNYTHIRELVDAGVLSSEREYHFSIDETTGQLVNATFELDKETGELKPLTGNVYTTSAMNGPQISLWWYSVNARGLEEALESLYTVAMTDPNHDLKESVDVENRKYSFSFGRKMPLTVNAVPVDNYFETRVEFELDENYFIKSATIYQSIYPEGFSTDENGHTTVNKGVEPEMYANMTFTQSSGERTAVNPYVQENLIIKDYDLVYKDKNGEDIVLSNGYTLEANAGDRIQLRLENIFPSSANFEYDLMKISEDGEGYLVYRSGNTLNLTFLGHGEYTLTITTTNTKKELHLVITGKAPTSLTAQVYRTSFKDFSDSNTAKIMVGVPLYFRATPNKQANDSYTVELLNATENATVVEVMVGEEKCWQLIAQETGTYEIKMTSSVASKISCTLTVTVVEAPNWETLLVGTYTATDAENGVYTLTFNQISATTGTVSIRYILNGETQSETLNYTIGDDWQLVFDSKSQLGVDIRVNNIGDLELEDRYSQQYVLIAQ